MLHELQNRKLTLLFHVLDRDKDGWLEADDFERLADRLAEVRGLEPGSASFETNRTLHRLSWWHLEPHSLGGLVSLDAFLAVNEELLHAEGGRDNAMRAMASSTFDALDAGVDGRITIEEQRQFYRAYGLDEALADRVFPLLDGDGDGYLSHSEMLDHMNDFFYGTDPGAPGNLMFGMLEDEGPA